MAESRFDVPPVSALDRNVSVSYRLVTDLFGKDAAIRLAIMDEERRIERAKERENRRRRSIIRAVKDHEPIVTSDSVIYLPKLGESNR